MMYCSRGILGITGILFFSCGLAVHLWPGAAGSIAPFLLVDISQSAVNLHANAEIQFLLGCFFLLCAYRPNWQFCGLTALLPIMFALCLSRGGKLWLVDNLQQNMALALAYNLISLIFALAALWILQASSRRRARLQRKWA